MCRCTPEIRTPFCGKPGCQWPEQADSISPPYARDRELASLANRVTLLEERIQAQSEIIAAYRDALDCFQQEKRLAAALHTADLAAIVKPKGSAQ